MPCMSMRTQPAFWGVSTAALSSLGERAPRKTKRKGVIDVLKTVNKTPDSKKSASQQNNCKCKTHTVRLPNYLIISSPVIYTPAPKWPGARCAFLGV